MSGIADHVPRKWLRWLVALAIVALAVYVVDSAADVVIPFVRRILGVVDPVIVAFALAYVLDPVVDWFEAHGRSRAFAIVIVVTVGLTLAAGFFLLAVPLAIEQAAELGPKLSIRVNEIGDGLADRLGPRYVEALDRFRAWVRNSIEHPDWETLSEPLMALLTSGKRLLFFVLDLVLVPILTIYLLKDMDGIKERMAGLVPPHRRQSLLEPLLEVDLALTGFVRGQLKVAAILTVMYTAGLVLTRTPLGVPLGLLAGVLSVVPYLGIAVVLVPALALNVLAHSSWPLALGVLATFGIAQFLEGNFITPRIMSRSVGLHPVLVILALMVGGAFFGIAGMVLAVPVTAAAMVFVRRGHSKYAASDFYQAGARPSRNRRGSDPPG